VATDDRFGEDVRSHIAITALLGNTPLRAEGLARMAQCSEDEAFEVLVRLAEVGALERLLNGSRSFRLTQASRAALHARIAYRQRTASDQQWEFVRAFLDVNDEIGRADVKDHRLSGAPDK
jgi:DNA-binding GntR family transcriptional regulator